MPRVISRVQSKAHNKLQISDPRVNLLWPSLSWRRGLYGLGALSQVLVLVLLNLQGTIDTSNLEAKENRWAVFAKVCFCAVLFIVTLKTARRVMADNKCLDTVNDYSLKNNNYSVIEEYPQLINTEALMTPVWRDFAYSLMSILSFVPSVFTTIEIGDNNSSNVGVNNSRVFFADAVHKGHDWLPSLIIICFACLKMIEYPI